MKHRSNDAVHKKGLARLLELAGEKKSKLVAACVLSVLSSAARIVPFFTIYGIITELLKNLTHISEIDTIRLWLLAGITFASALVYGVYPIIRESAFCQVNIYQWQGTMLVIHIKLPYKNNYKIH